MRRDLLSLIVVLISALPARAVVEEGVAKHIPWSGYWWPVAKGELLGPLEKYDTVVGKRAQWWELANKPPGPQVPPWHGYCHGWSAAAILEREPVVHQVSGGRSGLTPIALTVGDQKGWLSASHAFDVANYYGDRYGDGEGSEDIQDMAPDMLWQLMKLFIKQHGVPLVMDLDAGEQVWNYPVFAYRIEYYPSPMGGGWYEGYLQLCAADDSVPPDFVGTVPHLQNYTFVFQMRDGAVVMGSGRWTGYSMVSHPDFAWYPYVAMPENPELEYKTVKRLVGTGNATGAATNVGPDAWLGNGRDSAATGDNSDVPLPLGPLQLVAAIADKTSDFGLDAHLTEFGRVQYQVAEPYAIAGSSEEDGYLYVLHVSPEGELTLLHPAPGADNRIAAGATFQVPGPPAGHCLTTEPFGNHRIKVLVTKRPLSLTGLDRTAPRPVIGVPKMKTNGKPGETPPCQGYGFRFFPTQHKQVKALLTDYVYNKSLEEEPLSQIDTRQVLGKFAQDEITYYVGPAD